MWRVISHLNGPELVASFQRICGLFPKNNSSNNHHGLITTNGSLKDASVTPRQRKMEQVLNETSRADGNYSGAHENTIDEHRSGPQYEVRNWLFYFLFVTSASLGHEVFYITFLPSIQWNFEPFLCRRLVNMWAMRVDAEYGMPSTHAMAATAISFTLLLSARERVEFPFELGLAVAVLVSALVCLSRLYTGMHSALDVICGVVLSALIIAISYPFWTTIDYLQLHFPLSPVLAIVFHLLLCYKYPELDHYSTTRGDTTIIMACSAGSSFGYWVNERLGLTFDLSGPFPVTLQPLTMAALGLGFARFVVGVVMLVLTRQTMRYLTLRVICWFCGASVSDVDARKRKEIEVPYKFSTYVSVGLVNSMLVNRMFVKMGLWKLD
ncbi:hypothetical protein DNTS_030419 [Danionella cerebrum]|uniref:Phosphatidic acid phosphatase type 2/haloperoxidase domain-containing protein n=1 Tax=Danionella cerebrum TaxID=2873325 RepID=A0A553RGJ9_9TELE|nr:hypothetical protein DNTS_030419 [Danionella translucida]